MDREAKTAKAKVGAKLPPVRRSRPRAAADTRSVEQQLSDALEQQAATSEILRVMSASPTDVQPVMAAVAEQAARLCRSPYARVLIAEGDLMRPLAHYSVDGEYAAAMNAVPLQRISITGRAVIDRATIHHADVVPLLDTEFPAASKNVRGGGMRAVLAVPLMHKGDAYGAIFIWRREPGLFTPDQVALVETFATQAAIAIENVRLFRATQEALEQQTATSEILRVISRSQTDVQPVFETIAANALRLCDARFSAIFRYDGELIHIGAFENLDPERATAFRTAYPCAPSRGGTTQRAILTGQIVHMPDIRLDPEYLYQDVAKAADYRSVLSVPMLREGRPIGTITVYRDVARPFPDSQIELLKTFADQAVIAIENVRLFSELAARNRDLTTALDQRTATAEILRVISGSPTNVQPVFDAIVRSAVQLCGAQHSLIFEFDGEMLKPMAGHGILPEFNEYWMKHPMRPGAGSISGMATLQRKTIHVPDVLALSGYEHFEAQSLQSYRTVLAVPMLRGNKVTGVIVTWKNRVEPFTDKQVELVETFGDQAVIAIENVRLFKELEVRNHDLMVALEQQTATSDILRVISQSQTDVQPVFDTIAQAAHDLCQATSANVFTYDGDLVRLAAVVNADAAYVEAVHRLYPRKLSRDTAVLRAIMTQSIVVIPDAVEDPDYVGPMGLRSAAGGFRSILAVPLLREGSAIGGIAVGRPEAGPFPDTQVALLQTFADQAVIAVENVRLFKELEAQTNALTRSVRELKALGDVGQAVSSTLDLETVLSTIVSRAVQLTGMDGGSIYEYDEAREEFYLHTADRLPDELVEAMRATPMRKGEGVLGLMAMTAEPVQIRDIVDERSYQSRIREVVLRLGYRSILAVPLMRDNRLLGGLAVNRKTPGEFDSQVIDLLKTFATQSALAIQNARLFREIEIKSRQLETASRHKSEFLANMSHELRTPLNAIIGFSEVLSERLFGEMNEKQTEYVGDISESGRHLLNLINDILDLSKIEAGRMELDPSVFDIATTINNTLSLVRERAQRREIALHSSVDPRLGEIHADERKVRQVLLNLLSNAIKFTPEGGAIDVRATAFEDRTEISVTDTGVGIAPEDQEAVFEEFRQVGATAKKIEGTGLGLAISRKFIELHGGRIWVTSQPGVGSTFAFTLPLR